MKNVLILSLLFFFAFSCNKSTTNKNDKDKSQPDHLISNTFKPSGHVDIIIFEVDLRRNRGKNKDYKPCDCRYCLGFCNFRWFPAFNASVASVAVGKNETATDLGTVYFLGDVDSDELLVSDTFYIDEDVAILDEGGNHDFYIKSGEYIYTEELGHVVYDGDTLPYKGYINVDLY